MKPGMIARYMALVMCGVVIGSVAVLVVERGDSEPDSEELQPQPQLDAAEQPEEQPQRPDAVAPDDEPEKRSVAPFELTLSPDGTVTAEFRLDPQDDEPEEKQLWIPLMDPEALYHPPEYTSYLVGKKRISFAAPDELADLIEESIDVSLKGGSVDWELTRPVVEEYDVVEGVGIDATVGFEADEPARLIVESPAVVGMQDAEEEGRGHKQLQVFPYLKVDGELRENPTDVRLCVPGVDEFLRRYGPERVIRQQDPTNCSVQTVNARPKTTGWQFSTMGDGCLVDRIEPEEPVSVGVVSNGRNDCGEPGTVEPGYAMGRIQIDYWCPPGELPIWDELVGDGSDPLDGDITDDYVRPAVAQLVRDDEDVLDEMRPAVRLWHEHNALEHLTGYFQALRGEESESSLVNTCISEVDPTDAIDDERLGEIVEELEEMRDELELRRDAAVDEAQFDDGEVSLFEWE